ncbi:hypothetical protein K5X82_03180 [Halosquirtibacter xylanolyticus]|uniref:hypothetical protein n=1 Tax=Halosquirtibacter xylanolyticus TaxID=3374599 RepID=UPI0037487AD2|nr:hypothetical protein K5X82_03180 [Prolixibacteraceae bacterium]
MDFFKELGRCGAEFGYRTANEMICLIEKLKLIDASGMTSLDARIDIAIMQKLLPKLHGSRRKLQPVLETLATLCFDDYDVAKVRSEVLGKVDFDLKNAKYPISLEKILRMYDGIMDNGFVSYAEA